MKTILFPTDFSDNANHAMQYALQLAKDFEAHLHIINTYQIPYATAVPTAHHLIDALRKNAVDELNSCVMNIKSNHNYNNLSITSKAIAGDLLNAIAEIESNTSIDLIVLGTKGASGIKEVLIGSNAEQVVYHSKTSVLVVPENAPKFSFENVALATDLVPIPDTTIFNAFLTLCQNYASKIDVVYIEQSNISEIEKHTEKDNITDLLKKNNPSFHLIINASIIDGLNKFVEENNSNILGLVSRKYSFFDNIFHKSITNKLTCHTKLPIFVIKEK